MRSIAACTALGAALALAACQPAADGTETADAGEAASAEGAATEASADGGMVEARVREGLWLTTMTSEGMPAFTARMCMDERMSAVDSTNMRGGSASGAAGECDQTFDRTADGFDFTSRCDMGENGMTVTEGSMTGDFETAYRMESTMTTTGAPAMNGTLSMVTEAEYQGDCPEGWRPGDVEIAGTGMRVNTFDLQNQAMQAMPPTPPAG